MNEAINTSLTLLGVGMITVFMVLLFVVIVGNILITFVNRFIPEEIKPTLKKTDEINPSVIAAITASVEIFTKGKGKINQISKIK